MALKLSKSIRSFIGGSKGDVAVAFGAVILVVGGNSYAENGTVTLELAGESLLICIEGEVADEECVGRLADLVCILVATVLLSLLVAWLGVGKVDVQRTAIQVSSCLRLVSLGCIGGVLIVDVAISKDSQYEYDCRGQ